MEFGRRYRLKSQRPNIQHFGYGVHHHGSALVIKLPDPKTLRIVSRSVFLAAVILSLPYIGYFIDYPFKNVVHDDVDYGLTHSDSLDTVFQYLSNEGLIKRGDSALVVGSLELEPLIASSRFLNENDITLMLEPDLYKVASIPDGVFDLALVPSSSDVKFIDHVAKVGGIMVLLLDNESSVGIEKLLNYKIGYLRRYNTTIVAMRKTESADELIVSSVSRRLLQLPLADSEYVLFQPPRDGLAEYRNLIGDAIASYARRVFMNVDVGNEEGSMMEWFYLNYPMRNQVFDMYNIEVVREKSWDVSDWMKKNVKKEEYVVMKVEAEMAEEMIEKRAIDLVDEMLLECNNQWEDGVEKKSKRTYWDCLSLYGRLKDEGIAVNQWWGGDEQTNTQIHFAAG